MTRIFSVWRILVGLGWAKSGTWAVTTKLEQKVFLISLHVIKREDSKALSLIIGPLSVTVGFII